MTSSGFEPLTSWRLATSLFSEISCGDHRPGDHFSGLRSPQSYFLQTQTPLSPPATSNSPSYNSPLPREELRVKH